MTEEMAVEKGRILNMYVFILKESKIHETFSLGEGDIVEDPDILRSWINQYVIYKTRQKAITRRGIS